MCTTKVSSLKLGVIYRDLVSASLGEGVWPCSVIRHVRRDKSTAEGRHASQAVESSGSDPCSHQDEVGANVLGDAEIARRGGSAMNRRQQQIGLPSKIHRSLNNDATRRNTTRWSARGRCRVLLIDNYEASAREGNARCGICVSRACTRFSTRRRDATRIRDLRGGLNISATHGVPTIAPGERLSSTWAS